ncbi:hypothetical protein J5X84_14790 [Streptosporangiaceae bacterium NEAU-GS5]|nr:hypothetical protein [Streptosporangiaceae bacterium NEAU-GS5]
MRMKWRPAAVTTAALTILGGLAPGAPAASAASISLSEGYSARIQESGGVFYCPENQVLTGRAHHGDENGYTTYYCATIYVNGEPVEVSRYLFEVKVKENASRYETPEDNVVVGRRHDGDENGYTWYYSATLAWRGRPVHLVDRSWVDGLKESDHISKGVPGARQVMTGRRHSGDENGRTGYQYATVYFSG